MSRPVYDVSPAAFDAARLAGLARLNNPPGGLFSTIGEGSLHSVLKYWAEPDERNHEIALPVPKRPDQKRQSAMVADIFDGETVTEIQTRGFTPLRKKLERLRPLYPVTILYPVAQVKRLIWVDPVTGETTPPRKSPRAGTVWDVFSELIYIAGYLADPGVTLALVMLELDEYRLRNGWSEDGKKGSRRVDRMPTAVRDVHIFEGPDDFAALLRDRPPRPFTVPQLAKELRINKKRAANIVYVLYKTGVIIRKGKTGNAYMYDFPE